MNRQHALAYVLGVLVLTSVILARVSTGSARSTGPQPVLVGVSAYQDAASGFHRVHRAWSDGTVDVIRYRGDCKVAESCGPFTVADPPVDWDAFDMGPTGAPSVVSVSAYQDASSPFHRVHRQWSDGATDVVRYAGDCSTTSSCGPYNIASGICEADVDRDGDVDFDDLLIVLSRWDDECD